RDAMPPARRATGYASHPPTGLRFRYVAPTLVYARGDPPHRSPPRDGGMLVRDAPARVDRRGAPAAGRALSRRVGAASRPTTGSPGAPRPDRGGALRRR